MVRAAEPDGLVVVTVLSVVGAQSPGPFHAGPNELADAFAALPVEIVHSDEGNGEATVVARRVSRRRRT